jgi:hypothetical protein
VNGDPNLTKEKLLMFLDRLGASARSPGACFITGGGSALLLGWRETTIDIDLKFDPEPAGVFDAIPGLKRALHINVELAAPSDFLPPLERWRERSRFIAKKLSQRSSRPIARAIVRTQHTHRAKCGCGDFGGLFLTVRFALNRQ